MLKKLAWVAIIAMVGMIVVRSTGLSKYAKPMADKIKTKFEQSVPLEDQISAIKGQIAQLQPDVETVKTKLAEKMVANVTLKGETELLAKRLDGHKSFLQRSADELDSATLTQVSFKGTTMSASRARTKLAEEVATYERAEMLLKSKQDLLVRFNDEEKLIKEQLDALIEAQDKARTEVAQLETDLLTLRLAETRSKYQADDTKLAEVKQAMAKVKQRLDVAKTKLNLDAQYGTELVPSESKISTPIDGVAAVKAKFGKKNDVAANQSK